MGRATAKSNKRDNRSRFQSTPSVGRATQIEKRIYQYQGISIHALRGEGDKQSRYKVYTSNISIHALRGEGDEKTPLYNRLVNLFQSTPSVGRATL